MYALLRDVGRPVAAVRELVTLTLALVIAEVFYKFHSFTLECVAFLGTWIALGALVELAGRLFKGAKRHADQP
jgi:hypothetical protein